jgi:hypothetical protein
MKTHNFVLKHKDTGETHYLVSGLEDYIFLARNVFFQTDDQILDLYRKQVPEYEIVGEKWR